MYITLKKKTEKENVYEKESDWKNGKCKGYFCNFKKQNGSLITIL